MKDFIFCLVLFFVSKGLYAQSHFPQTTMNGITQKKLAQKIDHKKDRLFNHSNTSLKSVTGVLNIIDALKNSQSIVNRTNWAQSHDTIIVGVVPHDTLIITGNWTHHGPVLVLNDGVLIFNKATVVDSGDIYVFQHGKLLADSSSLTFPQQYFYQRGLYAVQNATVNIQHCSFNYSGLSHNLVIGGEAQVMMRNVHQRDWTTCGLFGKPSLMMKRVNQAGEFILSDSSTTVFSNTDTLLLWHQLPNTATINYSFPNGDTVYNYHFNKTIVGVSGIEYKVNADSCHNVMWAMMPVNGSNVTISNSKIRAIGAWFQHHDTVSVSHLYDNSSYANFTAPLSDRNLHLVNSQVQTWSLYVFDSSHITIDSCQVGEVGTQQRASINQVSPFLLDGSGGYYWATDTSAIFSFGATVYSYVRSEKNGIFVLAYGWVPFSAPQAIGNSIMINTQSNTSSDPVAFDAATTWLNKIDGPDTAFTNISIPIIGSTWIDWGPQGTGWMNFSKYSVYYQSQGSAFWRKIVNDSLIEIRHNVLANWNTSGLPSGNYFLKLTSKDNFGDSIEAIKSITLFNGVTALHNHFVQNDDLTLFPNPSNGLFNLVVNDYEHTEYEIYNSVGQKIHTYILCDKKTTVDLSQFTSGVYLIRLIKNNQSIYQARIIKN